MVNALPETADNSMENRDRARYFETSLVENTPVADASHSSSFCSCSACRV
jgi:hypothetical protein